MPAAKESPVDRLFIESSLVIQALGQNEPSLVVAAADNFRKGLLLAAASYFEYQISNSVAEFVHERTNGTALVVSFVKNKAIARQYHTWFNWTDSNANQFFGLFGSEFKQMMADRVKASEELKLSVRAFMELGSERNKLIHQDFASYAMDKTLDEVYALYKQALQFVEGIGAYLRECQASLTSSSTF